MSIDTVALLVERDALRAELAALRADAERYRFARSWGGTQHAHWNATPEQFDAAIDAAMRGEK